MAQIPLRDGDSASPGSGLRHVHAREVWRTVGAGGPRRTGVVLLRRRLFHEETPRWSCEVGPAKLASAAVPRLHVLIRSCVRESDLAPTREAALCPWFINFLDMTGASGKVEAGVVDFVGSV